MKRGLIGLCVTALLASILLFSCSLEQEVKNVFVVSFNANGADSGTAPEAMSVEDGGEIILPSQGTLQKTKCTFMGWNLKPDSSGGKVTASQRIRVYSDMTLYASWNAGKGSSESGESGKKTDIKGELVFGDITKN